MSLRTTVLFMRACSGLHALAVSCWPLSLAGSEDLRRAAGGGGDASVVRSGGVSAWETRHLKHLLHCIILLQLADVAVHLIELQLEILGLARALPVGDVEFAGHLAQEPLNLLGARHGRRARGDAHAVALRTGGGRGMSAEARL